MRRERYIPYTVLIGNQQSDSVVVTLGSDPKEFKHLLDYAALVGPCITDVPGVNWISETLRDSGIRNILIVGKNTAFHPKEFLERSLGVKYKLLYREEELLKTYHKVELRVKFVEEDKEEIYEKVQRGRDPLDDFAFVPYVDEYGVYVFIYNRDRQLIKRIRGKKDDVMDYILRNYKLAPSHVIWLIKNIYMGGD